MFRTPRALGRRCKKKVQLNKPDRPAEKESKPKPRRVAISNLGLKFVGFVSPANRDEAEQVAKRFDSLLTPRHVTHRLVLFTKSAPRTCGGAIAVVRKVDVFKDEQLPTTWDGVGLEAPPGLDDASRLNLWGILIALRVSEQNIDKGFAAVDRGIYVTPTSFHGILNFEMKTIAGFKVVLNTLVINTLSHLFLIEAAPKLSKEIISFMLDVIRS